MKPSWRGSDTAASSQSVPTEVDVQEWALCLKRFDENRIGQFEALFALGNGFWVTRGAAIEAEPSKLHYPGTYRAGLYERAVDWIDGKRLEHEDLVNLPNWLRVRFRTPNSGWFERNTAELSEFEQQLCLRTGVLTTRLCWREPNGNITRVQERRLVHMTLPNVASVELVLEPENWTGVVELCSELDGGVANANVDAYAGTAGRLLGAVRTERLSEDGLQLTAETPNTRVRIALAVRTTGLGSDVNCERSGDGERIELFGRREATQGRPVRVNKTAVLITSLENSEHEPRDAARQHDALTTPFEELLAQHERSWAAIWQRFAFEVVGKPAISGILRFHLFQLVQTLSPHSAHLDAGIPGRGWHGEGYRGHIFWDELFVFPILVLRCPELARSLLLYRYRRLPRARAAARALGHEGAMFPWRSASDGREVTEQRRKNPRSGRWIEDHSHLQRHINVAVAYNVWHYYEVTQDREFLELHGAELLLDTALFWSSLATWDAKRERYVIRGVVGPDEFHDAYPGASRPGIDNNAYTNLMAVWNIERALDVLECLSVERASELRSRLKLRDETLVLWKEITRKMFVPYEQGIIEQFEGFHQLQPFEWERYRAKYGDIHRLDDILEAEGDRVNRYQASKQADVLMLFYLLSNEELASLMSRLGYRVEGDLLNDNLEYYLPRTSHGSTLSRVVHAAVLTRADRRHSWVMLQQALGSDLGDIQGGTTKEGLHLGAMAGSVDIFQSCYLGLSCRAGEVSFDPLLPEGIDAIKLRICVMGAWLDVELSGEELTVSMPLDAKRPVTIRHRECHVVLKPGATHTFGNGANDDISVNHDPCVLAPGD